ncbi:classical arabinogalactan protein 9-like [Sus scrofa]|uniref:classical arabinogalactan protein 9-like n=1 Tax=Sus scrofa TaxID=9823 RepID=UPI000A2B3D84|nr:classical arabinogalactan protein 9-like [Sus scrofa]
MAPCFSCGPRPSPAFPLPWRSPPQPIAHHFPARGAVLLCPSGCPHIPSPSPLPRTDLPSLSLNAQPPPAPSASVCGVQAGGADDLCSSHSALPSSVQLLCFSPRLRGPSGSADLQLP